MSNRAMRALTKFFGVEAQETSHQEGGSVVYAGLRVTLVLHDGWYYYQGEMHRDWDEQAWEVHVESCVQEYGSCAETTLKDACAKACRVLRATGHTYLAGAESLSALIH